MVEVLEGAIVLEREGRHPVEVGGVSADLLYGFGHIILQNTSHQHPTVGIFSYDRCPRSAMMRCDAAVRFRVSGQHTPGATTRSPEVLSYKACPCNPRQR